MKMKIKVLMVLFAVCLLSLPSFAGDKGVAKVGPVSLKSVSNGDGADSVAASVIGNRLLIALGGSVGLSSGLLSIFLPADADFSKGQEFDVTSDDNDTDGTAIVNFLVQKTQVKGTSAVITSYSTNSDSVGSGKLKVISYDPDTKLLKFNLTAKVAPYTRTVNFAAKDITSPLAVTANISVTLP